VSGFIIDRNRQYIYVSIPKNASTAMRLFLESPETPWQMHGNHMIRKHVRDLGLTAVLVSRNPYSRAVSSYRFTIHTSNVINIWKRTLNRDVTNYSFLDWCRAVSDTNDKLLEHHSKSQLWHIRLMGGEIVVDKKQIFPSETLHATWTVIKKMFGTDRCLTVRIPRQDKPETRDFSDYRSLYCKESLDLVSARYSDDFSFFGYNKCSSLADLYNVHLHTRSTLTQ